MSIPEDIIEHAHKGTATKKDAFELLDVNPFELYALADDLRKKAVGDTVTYVTNRNTYITNFPKGEELPEMFSKYFSGKNENVFYEAGIAHSLGKNVIPITQSIDNVPFDLRHHRHIVYLNRGILRLSTISQMIRLNLRKPNP